jgi:hypothetical protein
MLHCSQTTRELHCNFSIWYLPASIVFPKKLALVPIDRRYLSVLRLPLTEFSSVYAQRQPFISWNSAYFTLEERFVVQLKMVLSVKGRQNQPHFHKHKQNTRLCLIDILDFL